MVKMEARAPNHRLEILMDPGTSRDVIKGVLQTVFFHRLFPTIRPLTRPIPSLSLSLPAVDDVDLESLLNDRASALLSQLQPSPPERSPNPYDASVEQAEELHGILVVRFFEKRWRRTATTGYTLFGRGYEEAEEKICWERWTVEVTMVPIPVSAPTPVATGTQQGIMVEREEAPELQELRGREARILHDAVMRVIDLAGEHKEHIPPITTTEENPFPYEIEVRVGKDS